MCILRRMLGHTLYKPLEVPSTSKRCQTLQYAWQRVAGCFGRRMPVSNEFSVCLTAWMLTVSCAERGHIVNEGGYIFILFGGLRPPQTDKDPGFVENSSSPIDWWGQIAKRRSGPPSKSYVLVRSLNRTYKKKFSHIYIQYIYIVSEVVFCK